MNSAVSSSSGAVLAPYKFNDGYRSLNISGVKKYIDPTNGTSLLDQNSPFHEKVFDGMLSFPFPSNYSSHYPEGIYIYDSWRIVIQQVNPDSQYNYYFATLYKFDGQGSYETGYVICRYPQSEQNTPAWKYTNNNNLVITDIQWGSPYPPIVSQ